MNAIDYGMIRGIPFRGFFSHKQAIIQGDDRANRLRRLLAEFLQKKYSQLQQCSAQETIEAQNSGIGVNSYHVTLPYDLLFKIFILLPAESLFRLQFVCKKWFGLINGSNFITCQSQQSETVLFSQKLIILKPDFYAAMLPHLPLEENPNMKKSKNLILMNPVTRKHIMLPLGTVGRVYDSSYGIASHAHTYKVVHLFRRVAGFTACEILSISTRTWKTVEESSGLFGDLRKIPVSIGGSLYWLSMEAGCDYVIAMNMEDEKFIRMKLPVLCGVKDRILEIGGNLGLVTHPEVNLMEVWIIMNDGDWIKSYRINLDVDFGYQPIPICSSRNGKEMVFECPGLKLYVYNFEKGEMKLVHSGDDDANEVLASRDLYVWKINDYPSYWAMSRNQTIHKTKRNMDTRSVVGKTSSLLREVEKRIQLKRELEESQKKQKEKKEPQNSLISVPYLAKDCIFNIIVRLPLESLQTSRFVSKSWFQIVNNPVFVDAHLRRSDFGLIFLTPVKNNLPFSDFEKPSSSSSTRISFSVESKVLESQSMPVHHYRLIDPPSLFYINFLEIKDGKSTIKEYKTTCMGKIRATCNGLIVLDNLMKRKGLIVLNPVTRELKTIPLGTKCSTHKEESYGLAYCNHSSKYKLVHLFKDELAYIGCEIMNIGSGSWRVVDGPPHGFFGSFGCGPVFALGALHWIPRDDHNEYVVSMLVDHESFRKIPLPHGDGIHDRVLEMSGFLGFVSRQNTSLIDVWILRSLGGESWEKKYSIHLDGTRNMVPLFCMRAYGELVFKCKDDDLYVYDQFLQFMRKVKVNKECFPFINCYFPHVNSLVSWN
ncbi:hypothetical protein BUALT_Bualt08G0136100 [Buddleja alternifolia]|uniref:F-box domain-containing protein n=1 Tax=Buddleja alternifolia TaxID=168488 RepID=A0AAV6X6I2_9LAMI|nr:hypothetical protein BUALT_Bualt08G0136100 [Buddleja alternifolia]